MKLDNKGFAFSTLLYGILAVIIVVLMLLFGLYSRTSDEIYYYATMSEESLNKCVEQEIALENCYANTNPSIASSYCNTTAYYACLGIDDNTISSKKENAKDYLIRTMPTGLTSVSGYYMTHVFKGTDVKNYASFSGLTWRIIGITNSGLIKLALFGKTDVYKWDNGNSDDWSNSTLFNYLNNEFLNSLRDKDFLYKNSFNVGRVNSSSNPNAASIYSMEQGTTYASLVGLPNITDYVKATTNTACNSNIIDTSNCVSWMTKEKSWIINPLQSGQNKAYYMNGGETNPKITTANLTENYKVIPVVYLSADIQVYVGAGDGSSGSPFKLGK